jgi:hypothetical protein
MWRCKQVSHALFQHHHWDLPVHKRMGLKLHIALCVFCGRFQRQVMAMQDMARKYRLMEEEDQTGETVRLSAEARDRLRKTLGSTPGR